MAFSWQQWLCERATRVTLYVYFQWLRERATRVTLYVYFQTCSFSVLFNDAINC
jgi:hypothetical protein